MVEEEAAVVAVAAVAAAVAAEPVAEDGAGAALVVAEEEIQVLAVVHHQVMFKSVCHYFSFPLCFKSQLRLLQHQVEGGSFSKLYARTSADNPQLAIDQ